MTVEGYEVYNNETGETLLFETFEEAQHWLATYNSMLKHTKEQLQ